MVSTSCSARYFGILLVNHNDSGIVAAGRLVKGVDEAVALANDSPYGLQAAVFTNDIATALDVAHRLEVL